MTPIGSSEVCTYVDSCLGHDTVGQNGCARWLHARARALPSQIARELQINKLDKYSKGTKYLGNMEVFTPGVSHIFLTTAYIIW